MSQHKFIKKELIDKGWSGDKKYCVTDEQGNKFLLRVSPIEQYERKKSEYELMNQVAALGVPMKFWELLALYISSNTLSSVPWAIPFGDEQVQVMVNQAKDVLSWYDDMKNPVPTWYKGTKF